jgi:hypothetical protein
LKGERHLQIDGREGPFVPPISSGLEKPEIFNHEDHEGHEGICSNHEDNKGVILLATKRHKRAMKVKNVIEKTWSIFASLAGFA